MKLWCSTLLLFHFPPKQSNTSKVEQAASFITNKMLGDGWWYDTKAKREARVQLKEKVGICFKVAM
jgi:hypothetical protein